jgi:hypothetical protein
MRGITFILSIFILFLSLNPCSDGKNTADQEVEEISFNHDHQEDTDDNCPVTCNCNCCGMTISTQLIIPFEIIEYIKISTQKGVEYQSTYQFDFHFSIWEPPQIIS